MRHRPADDLKTANGVRYTSAMRHDVYANGPCSPASWCKPIGAVALLRVPGGISEPPMSSAPGGRRVRGLDEAQSSDVPATGRPAIETRLMHCSTMGRRRVSSRVGWSASRWFEPQSAYVAVAGAVGQVVAQVRARGAHSLAVLEHPPVGASHEKGVMQRAQAPGHSHQPRASRAIRYTRAAFI